MARRVERNSGVDDARVPREGFLVRLGVGTCLHALWAAVRPGVAGGEGNEGKGMERGRAGKGWRRCAVAPSRSFVRVRCRRWERVVVAGEGGRANGATVRDADAWVGYGQGHRSGLKTAWSGGFGFNEVLACFPWSTPLVAFTGEGGGWGGRSAVEGQASAATDAGCEGEGHRLSAWYRRPRLQLGVGVVDEVAARSLRIVGGRRERGEREGGGGGGRIAG